MWDTTKEKPLCASADPKNWANSCCWRAVLLFKDSKLGEEMNSRGPNGSWSFSLVGHWAEPQQGQWVLGAMVGCQLFIMSSAKGIYWFQINFYCMQFSQHEMLHCHIFANPQENLLPPPKRFLLKSHLEKCPDCELRLEELKEPSPAVGGGTALQGEWQCSCTLCS